MVFKKPTNSFNFVILKYRGHCCEKFVTRRHCCQMIRFSSGMCCLRYCLSVVSNALNSPFLFVSELFVISSAGWTRAHRSASWPNACSSAAVTPSETNGSSSSPRYAPAKCVPKMVHKCLQSGLGKIPELVSCCRTPGLRLCRDHYLYH